MSSDRDLLAPTETFPRRHIGPSENDVRTMLEALGYDSLDALVDDTIPAAIRLDRPLHLDKLDDDTPLGEHEVLEQLGRLAGKNDIFRSLIGMGYADCHVPAVIQRNVLENPGWYTQYTPYQAEIAQGRLEALLNFQTMVSDLTGLPVANASLLDEATAAAEAMGMAWSVHKGKRPAFFVADGCHPQTPAVLATRASGLGIELRSGDPMAADLSDVAGVLVQYPNTDGHIVDYDALVAHAHEAGALVIVACDPLALVLLRSPGDFGADVAIGTTQRFGVPLGFGGPHAAFFACGEKHKRLIPGRLVGASHDAHGKLAYRLALQTREQHIRRAKATSNICTAQALLAIMASMYAVYHGPDGLRKIASRVRALTRVLAAGLERLGYRLSDRPFFDTLRIDTSERRAERILAEAADHHVNLRRIAPDAIGVSLDEVSDVEEIESLLRFFNGGTAPDFGVDDLLGDLDAPYPGVHERTSPILEHPVFHAYHTETEMLRYLKRLENRDLSLAHSMIPLGSCTMKLNATVEMVPVTWEAFGRIHPFAPESQTAGYQALFHSLESWLGEITGFPAVSLQPNAGAQGEYAGLMVIRAYHHARGDEHRDVCLIPVSAHGTNPASAVMAGMRVVTVACDDDGNVDLDDVRAKAAAHADKLAALMITYPSTHGVFEENVREICDAVHEHGGQVYLDGANMNAQVGLCRPADYGADVCHLNLHKTFCIPHGGGGPGMGPIGVQAHLAPHIPDHPVITMGGSESLGAVSAAPWGSASILPISWVYIALMGAAGLRRASEVAILNANYMAAKLEEHYDVLFRGDAKHGKTGLVAHEFILDLRPFKKSAGIEAEDVAKRLIDYGFHAPTLSWPVAGTLMVEPTESESKEELDRFCDALVAIRNEIRAIENGELAQDDNPLKNAPHTIATVSADDWPHAYSRQVAAFPAPWLTERKFWPPVGRVDNAYGDRHLVCTCPPLEAYEEAASAV
ncbi:MAG: aminomethyl-transferring glycine dehydrogenase [Acidobacteriota bacterium]